jgi:phage repressor protein C with HTH and peptisase S24 domain
MERGERVIDRALRWAKERGWNQTEFAAAMDVAPANLTNWKARDMPADQHARAARVLGRTIDELVGAAPVAPNAGESIPPYAVGRHSLAPILAWQYEDDLPEGEFVFVPRLRINLSAGHGSDQVEIEFVQAQPQAFRADWIRKERLHPNRLASMYATGDSMQPSIFDGDSLVVDTSQTEVIDGRVYALWYEGGERVKRLYRIPGGGLRIHSDNAAEYPAILLDKDHVGHIRIVGRVVHRSGKGGL